MTVTDFMLKSFQNGSASSELSMYMSSMPKTATGTPSIKRISLSCGCAEYIAEFILKPQNPSQLWRQMTNITECTGIESSDWVGGALAKSKATLKLSEVDVAPGKWMKPGESICLHEYLSASSLVYLLPI